MNYRFNGPQDFREVWTALGSNSVPFLLQALERPDKPVPHFDYGAVYSKYPDWLKTRLIPPSPPATVVRTRAASALGIIGEGSEAAVPALIHVIQTDESGLVRQAATNALRKMDPVAAKRAGIP
jgi:HEAT repeat protein